MPEKDSKSVLEVLVLPVAIALVGIVSTQMITRSQLASADKLAQASLASQDQRATNEQQIKILEMFSDQIKSGVPAQRKMALRILTALEPELAEKLAQAVADTDADPETRQVAAAIVKSVAQSGNTFVVIGSYPSLQEAKDKVAALQKDTGGLPFTPEVYLAQNHYYALTLGGHLSPAESKKRLPAAKAVTPDAYLRMTDQWGENLLK